MSLLDWPRNVWSGPIAALVEREDDEWLHCVSFETQTPEDRQWFRSLLDDCGADEVFERCGEGRKVFIVFGRILSERYASSEAYSGYEYEWSFVPEGEL